MPTDSTTSSRPVMLSRKTKSSAWRLTTLQPEQAEEGEPTSSNFSGRPFKPPLGSCRSESHHASVPTSTRSNLSRIANAATQTKTASKSRNISLVSASRDDISSHSSTHFDHRDSRSPHPTRTLHRNSYIARCAR